MSTRSKLPADSLSPELWRRLEPLLDEALEEPEEEREDWAHRATESQPDLREPLLAWIERCAMADGFLETAGPLAASGSGAESAGGVRPEERLGLRLGPHRLVEILGQGGMGVVYLGRREDGLFEQEVAIKVADHRLGPEGLERFRWERRILASLEHPSIARLFDGGTLDDGAPYLVMECIDGEALDLYCGHRKTPRQGRLELVLKVLRALDYAHRRRVVHLDLKPSNILVTRGGSVKLVDFGIAQMLTEGEAGPPWAEGGLTPSYAAPERWHAAKVTSSSDLYSVGVILFQLLTGRFPKSAENGSTLRAGAGAELDAILSRLLALRPEDRYTSAASAAADLDGYLQGSPVAALGGGVFYLVRKHVAKHRRFWAVMTASLLVAALLAFSWWNERQRGRRQLEVVASFSRLAESGESFLRYVYALPAHDVRREKALALERLGEIERRMDELGELASAPGHFALGRGWASLRDAKKSAEHLEIAWQQGLRSPELAFALGASLGELYARERDGLRAVADAEMRRQMLESSQRRYRDRALELLRLARGPSELVSPNFLAGLIAYYDGELEGALISARSAAKETPWLADGWVLAAKVLLRKAELLTDSGRHDDAARTLAEARHELALAAALAPSDPDLGALSCSLELRALDLERQRGSSVEEAFAPAEERCLAALELDPEQPEPLRMLATFEILRGQSPRRSVAARQDSIARALSLLEKAPTKTWDDAEMARTHAAALLSRAILGLATGAATAPADLEQASGLFKRSLELDPGQILARMNLATTFAVRARVAQATGGSADVETLFELSAAAFEEALERLPESTLLLYNLASQHYSRGLWLDGQNKPSQASYTSSLDIARRVLARNDSLPHALNLHAAVLERLVHQSLDDGGAGLGAEPVVLLAEGLSSLDRAVGIDAGLPAAWMTRGALLATWSRVLGSAGDHEQALSKVQEALASLEEAERLMGRRSELWLRNAIGAHLLKAELERTLLEAQSQGLDLERLRRLLEDAKTRFPVADWEDFTRRHLALVR